MPPPREGALVFTSRHRAFQLILSSGFSVSGQSAPNEQHNTLEITHYVSAGLALHHIIKSNCWLLTWTSSRVSILYRESLLVLPERHWMLLRAEDVNAGGFQDFRGLVFVMPEVSMSPHDHKLLARQTMDLTPSNGWGRLLGGYLESLDADTLRLVAREDSGCALIEQQVMALLRRALLERADTVQPRGRPASRASGTKSRGELLFKDICIWITDNYVNPDMSSDLVAKHFNVSSRYIQNLFAKYGEGATFVSFLREKRLQRARDMLTNLEHANQNISEICWNCGFSDPVYFGKAFRDFFGITPGQARRQSFGQQ